MVNNYDTALEKISKKLNQYNDLEINFEDTLKVISASSRIGKLFVQGAQYASSKRFEGFLKGLGNSGGISNKRLEKLEEYVSNEKRARFICEQLDKVIKSNSIRATMMMGLLLNQIMNDDEDPSFRDLIIINTLSELYDTDIDNLEYILTECSGKFRVSIFVEHYSREMWMDYFKREKTNFEELNYSLEKAMKFQLINEIFDPMKNQEFDLEPYSKPEYQLRITPLGKEVLKLSEMSKITE